MFKNLVTVGSKKGHLLKLWLGPSTHPVILQMGANLSCMPPCNKGVEQFAVLSLEGSTDSSLSYNENDHVVQEILGEFIDYLDLLDLNRCLESIE